MRENVRRRRTGLSRRAFLKYSSAGAGLLLGAEPLLRLAGRADARGLSGGGPTEQRTYFFDLSHLDTSAHDLVVVAGTQRVSVHPTAPEVLKQARQDHPILGRVSDQNITHHVTLTMPADAVQLCYVQRIARGTNDGSWDTALLFYHHSTAALEEAQRRAQRRAGTGQPAMAAKWQRHGITADVHAALADPLADAALQDPTSHAQALIASHPELASLEPNSAADIQTNIIGPQASTVALANILRLQGANWARQAPVIDPDTGQPFQNSAGQNQYVPVWSALTLQHAGGAISQALDTVKDDRTLGVNVTAIDPTTITTGDPTAPTNGKIWTRRDGRPTIDQSPTAADRFGASAVGDASGLTYQFTDQSDDLGYSVAVTNVTIGSEGNRSITFTAVNSYARHLGLWVRYLDADGQPIPLDDSRIAPVITDQWFQLHGLVPATTYDVFLGLIGPEMLVLGIPVHAMSVTQTFPLPPGATSALILASGLGQGDNSYPDTLAPGIIMTAFLELSLPALFLALSAAGGYAELIGALQNLNLLIQVLQIVLPAFTDILHDMEYGGDYSTIVVGMAAKFLTLGAGRLPGLIFGAIALGAVENAIPLIGTILSAIQALGIAAQLDETSTEVATCPKTYVGEITFTHDVAVTISHDPTDGSGFPATATSYTVTALFDNGTPYTSTSTLSGTRTAPITVTFSAVPAGGQVTASVGFYSNDLFLVGTGSVGPVPNTPTDATLQLPITIKEILVPLTANTTYSHKEIIGLDSAGNHQWQPTTTPPSVVTPKGLCEDVAGQICALNGITVSTQNAAVAYAWEAYSSGVTQCGSGALRQLNQFANLSTTQTPESGRLTSGCGFPGTTRVVYDPLGSLDRNFYLDPTFNAAVNASNFIRQVRLTSPLSYDPPGSNQAWGSLRFASDALLLHPQGKIISLNASLHKFEVLDLPPTAVADADAPQSQVYSGIGTREGRMNAPTHAAVSAQGTILVLETGNNRIQAFDVHGNAVPQFAGGNYSFDLVDTGATYLDLAVEYIGYLYVLSYTGSVGSYLYRLDIYTPAGSWLARTTGINADKLAVNSWRDVFTLNYQVLTQNGSLPALTEPSVSHWIPSTP